MSPEETALGGGPWLRKLKERPPFPAGSRGRAPAEPPRQGVLGERLAASGLGLAIQEWRRQLGACWGSPASDFTPPPPGGRCRLGSEAGCGDGFQQTQSNYPLLNPASAGAVMRFL